MLRVVDPRKLLGGGVVSQHARSMVISTARVRGWATRHSLKSKECVGASDHDRLSLRVSCFLYLLIRESEGHAILDF